MRKLKSVYLKPKIEMFRMAEPMSVLARLSLKGSFDEELEDGGEAEIEDGVDPFRYWDF